VSTDSKYENENELDRLKKENSLLRSFVASNKGCNHCMYGARLESGACQMGHPGCSCLDDIMLYESEMTDGLVAALVQAYSVSIKNKTMTEAWFERARIALEPYVPLDDLDTEQE